jgi:hypothetical protein
VRGLSSVGQLGGSRVLEHPWLGRLSFFAYAASAVVRTTISGPQPESLAAAAWETPLYSSTQLADRLPSFAPASAAGPADRPRCTGQPIRCGPGCARIWCSCLATPWSFPADVPGREPIHGHGGSEYLGRGRVIRQPGRTWHGRPGDENPHACAGSGASALYRRWHAGVVSFSRGFGGLRLRCPQAKVITVTVAVAVAFVLGDVCEGLCGPGQWLSAQPDPAAGHQPSADRRRALPPTQHRSRAGCQLAHRHAAHRQQHPPRLLTRQMSAAGPLGVSFDGRLKSADHPFGRSEMADNPTFMCTARRLLARQEQAGAGHGA